MTFKYNNVYINEVSTVAGPYEAKGPLNNYYDYTYNDLYFNKKTWELAEISMHQKCIDILLLKTKLKPSDIDLLISGDLLNQIVSSNFTAASIGIPLIGIYAACSTSTLGLILAANMINSKQARKIITSVS